MCRVVLTLHASVEQLTQFVLSEQQMST